MNPLVRDLYKRIILVGKDYPGQDPFVVLTVCFAQGRRRAKRYVRSDCYCADAILGAAGLDHVRRKAKEAFHKNKDLTDEVEIKRAVARGRSELCTRTLMVLS